MMGTGEKNRGREAAKEEEKKSKKVHNKKQQSLRI